MEDCYRVLAPFVLHTMIISTTFGSSLEGLAPVRRAQWTGLTSKDLFSIDTANSTNFICIDEGILVIRHQESYLSTFLPVTNRTINCFDAMIDFAKCCWKYWQKNDQYTTMFYTSALKPVINESQTVKLQYFLMLCS